jgi:hypothetical protein
MQYKAQVTGQPGTQRIPVQPPQVPSPDPGDIAQMGTSRSSDAPGNWILPNLYYARPHPEFWPGAGQPVSLRNDMMPVPAVDPRGVPARLAVPVNIRGARQVKARRPAVSWPPYAA